MQFDHLATQKGYRKRFDFRSLLLLARMAIAQRVELNTLVLFAFLPINMFLYNKKRRNGD